MAAQRESEIDIRRIEAVQLLNENQESGNQNAKYFLNNLRKKRDKPINQTNYKVVDRRKEKNGDRKSQLDEFNLHEIES